VAGLTLSGNTQYGTTLNGGSSGYGSVFALNTDGTGFTNLYSFTGRSDGGTLRAGLILSGNTLYGTAQLGGTNGYGSVFALNTDGTGFATRHSFNWNSDGGEPWGGLILSGNTLYGTAQDGGTNGYGTVFKLNTDGTGFATLHTFSWYSDGAEPIAGLILSCNMLYGMAQYGSINGNGTVFAVNTNGTGFTTLYSFTALSNSTNGDGAYPWGGLILSGNTLYGTAESGGTNGNGTVFAVNTNGTGFTILYSFTGGSDGSIPRGGLILSDNTLYGTAFGGGTNGNGTVFSLSLPAATVSRPQLTIIPLGTNVILTWPTNFAGYALQSTTNLLSPSSWITNSTPPVVVNTNYAVTNAISGAQQFYRLSQ
jgi:uncharacterized repeat protein (TIGR03803 family)